MVWRPSAVQLRNVKQKNCGSYFTARQVQDSPALRQAAWLKTITNSSLMGNFKTVV